MDVVICPIEKVCFNIDSVLPLLNYLLSKESNYVHSFIRERNIFLLVLL